MSLASPMCFFAVLSFFLFLVLCLLLCLVLGVCWCLGGEKTWESKGIFWVCLFIYFFLGLLIFSGFLGLLIFFSLFAFLENK